MANTDLLAHVLPDEGWYCIMGLNRGMPKQHFVETLEEVSGVVDKLAALGCDVYFGCAKFDSAGVRKQANATHFKAFWLDIDCGYSKPYNSQTEGLQALREFCAANKLPKPTLVDSGRGIHAYWTLTKAITKDEWQPIANHLKQMCIAQRFQIDVAVPADAARILRVPGTINSKNGAEVTLLHVGEHADIGVFGRHTNGAAAKIAAIAAQPVRPNALTMALAGNRISVFKRIMDKTADGNGCAQLERAILEQETLEEPMWRAALSVANVCEDRDKAIHFISRRHPDYDPVKTDEKASKTQGPYTCDTFATLYPAGCEECPNKGKIKSPVVLGHDIAAAEPQEAEPDEEGTPADPPLPFPYFRGKAGGIYRAAKDEDPILIYEHDLTMVKRMVDPSVGECAWLRRWLPRDGTKEFAVPMSSMLNKDEMKKILPANGILAGVKQTEGIVGYLTTVAKEMQLMIQAEQMRNQFGWADDDTKIILGDREITATGVNYSPPSVSTNALSRYLQPKGSFEKWKKIFNTYALPGFEPHAFAALTGFGAPLMKFFNIHGCTINLLNSESGTGKSTILHMANSIIGHPEELLLQWKDTYNGMIHRLGVMNNFMVGIDEITKMHPDLVSDILYSTTQGRGKIRMKHGSNEERQNDTKWWLPTVTTSNSSILDRLSALKAEFDGEQMRVMEYKIELTGSIGRAEAAELFGGLFENYGHAAGPYLQYITANKEAVMALAKRVQAKLDDAIGLMGKERFWSAASACNLAGGMVAHQLGLHDIDMARIYKWLVPTVAGMRIQAKEAQSSPSTVIGEFISQHINNILVVNGNVDARTKLWSPPLLEPRGELIIRYEPDTKSMFIAAKNFRSFCASAQITYKDVVDRMKKQGIMSNVVRKRMTRGSKVAAPAVDAIMLDCSSGDFVDMDSYVEQAKEGVV